jgi:hypothetical protein
VPESRSTGAIRPGAGTVDLTADSTVKSGDDVAIQFGIDWDFTAGNNNTHESYRSHILDSSGNQIDLRNDFAKTSALPAVAGASAQRHIDPQTGWILLGDHFDEPQAGDDWIELGDSYVWRGHPTDADRAGATAE